MIQQMALPSYNFQQQFSTKFIFILTVAKEFSYIFLWYLSYDIARLNCLGINTYTGRIFCLFLLLCLRLLKCFHILLWQRMQKIVLKITQFHKNLAMLNVPCTIVHLIFISKVWPIVQALYSSMFCLCVYFCIADYVGCF
jgi:hypothetical protein